MLPTSPPARLGSAAVLLAICLAPAGCAKSKLTQENFDKIKNVMTLAQVEGLLGEGTSQGGDGANVAAQFGVDVGGGNAAAAPATVDYVWEKGKKSITVTFQRGGGDVQRSGGTAARRGKGFPSAQRPPRPGPSPGREKRP